ncbi:MAG: calcium/sodium antiporter [Bacteroidales bacterium]|nr:calcium/sodium antiporter [Bacteroidales bacterium]
MSLGIQILILVFGLILVVVGADVLVEGASSIARRSGVSEFVIGLAIVGFGTSLPELVVSVTGALEGNSAIAIGNVIGSNIINSQFILAISALVAPIAITRSNKFRDIPITLLVTFLVILCGLSVSLLRIGHVNGLSRIEGAVLVALFICYLVYCFLSDKPAETPDEADKKKTYPMWMAVILVVAGLGALVIGGRFFVNSAVKIARMIGVSDKFIAITVLALGTSLPELATSIVALAKGRSQLALGNILGSNVFNLLLILGVSALISPMGFSSVTIVDAGALALSAVLIWTSVYTGKKNYIDRFDAVLMMLAFAAYMVWLFMKL